MNLYQETIDFHKLIKEISLIKLWKLQQGSS